MDGLNVDFRGSPIEFMQTHILHPNPSWSIEGGISSGANRDAAFYFVRGQLQCLICKTTPDKCACPA